MINIKKYFKNENIDNLNNIDNCILSDNEKNEIIKNIITLHDNNLSKELIFDLELLKGNYDNYQESVVCKLDNTLTSIGNFYFNNILISPLHDITKLQNRQNIINEISISKDFNVIENYLQELKKNENNLLWLWKKNDKETDDYLNSVYFQNKFLTQFNNNDKILNAFNYYKIVIAPLIGVLYPVVAIIIPYLIIRFVFKLPINFSTYYKLISSSMGGGLFPMSNNSSLFKMSKLLSSFFYVFFYLHNTYFSFTYSINTNKIINIIHNKINSIYKYVKIANQLNVLLEKIIPEKINHIGEHYNSEVFQKQPGWLSNKGIILKEYKYITHNKNELLPILNYVGLIDSYFSIAKLYNDNKKNKSYSLCNYVNSNKPIIDIKNVWHPYLNNTNVIKNSIELGGDKKQNVIITGPNAGGKSTFIKALMLSVLLSQTITISPCESISLTPFHFMSTYLNIPDCKGKESLFEAEMNRSLNYINKLRELEKENKFSIVVMDEIFNSTNPKEGISGAYAICKKISSFKNNVSVITTHFNYLTKLKNHDFENYKIPVKKIKNQINYEYKLIKGVSKQFIALDLLKIKGFDNEIIEESKKIYNKIKNKNIN